MNKGLLGKIIGVVTSTAVLVSAVFVGAQKSTNNFSRLTADTYNVTLNSSNAPSLSSGSATRVDDKGVTWEYYNASDYSSGHVALNHQGYFGISSTSQYGYTGVSNLVANFSAGEQSELWLLKSVDGITWSEDCILTSGLPAAVNGWRYFRFYNYSTDNSSIRVNSIQFGYSCEGISSTEDVDGAKASNVIATSSNLNYAAEYSDLSPNSVGGEAVKFTKTTTSGSTNLTIGFGNTYKIGDIQNSKIEFDMKTSNINYGKTIQLMKDNTGFGSAVESSKTNSYKCTNIQDDWYHIEVPITTFVSTISGYKNKDLPATNVENKEINAIKINAGTCVIDNLRVTSIQCSLGIFNNPDYKPSVNEFFWLKVAWVGKLYPEQATITFDDDTLVRHIPITDPSLYKGSPFYIQLLGTGSVTVTCTVVSGYNRTVHTIQHTIVVK